MMLGLTKFKFQSKSIFLRCCAQNAINKYKHLDTYKDSKCSERVKMFDERSFRHLKRLAKDDARLNATKIASNLNVSLPKRVITRKLRTYLKERNFQYMVKMKKQWLGI